MKILATLLLLISSMPALAGDAPSSDEVAVSVARMARVGRAFSPSFSPDGQRIAMVADLSGIPQIWIVAAEGGWPEQITAFDDPVGAVRWSPIGDWLAFSLLPGGGLNSQIYLIRPDGTGLRRLTDGGKDNNWLGEWTPDGKFLTLASNRSNTAGGMDAYFANVASGALRRVSQNSGVGEFSDVSRDGRSAVLYRQRSRGDNDLLLVNVSDGREVKLTPHQGVAESFNALFADDRTAYFVSNVDRDRQALARVRLLADGTPGPLEIAASRDDAELAEIEINEQGTMAALLWNVGGRDRLAFFDLASGKMTDGPEFPADLATGITFSRDGNHLAMTLSGSASPLNVWTLDVRTGHFRQVTRSPHPGVDLTRLVRPELVEFTAHDGLKLSGWLYRPAGRKGLGPVVLSFHGGPEGQELPSFRSDYQALLAQGVAVFAPNVRGSSGFGKKFVNLDNGALRVNGVRDIKACVDYVVQSGVADPKRVGIMGGSYGGYMVMAGLTEFPDLFAAGANLFGVVNFKTFFAHTEPWMAAISTVEYGDPVKEAALLQSLSPIHKVDRINAPTIVLHGANDTNVPLVEAEQVVDSLRKRGVPVEYVLFPDEGHGWRKVANRIRSTVAIVRWFSQHLKAE
ncbi:MAG: S9 family peptidase [Terriglobales bacterium]